MEGTRLNMTNQDSGKALSPGVVALAFSGVGLASVFWILGFTMDLGVLPLLAFSFWSVVLLCVAIRTLRCMWRLGPETPEWSKNDRRMTVLGYGAWGGGGAFMVLITDPLLPPLGMLMVFSGIALVLIPELHPKKRTKKTTSIQKEGGAEGGI